MLVITGKGASPFARHTLHGAEHFHAPERQGRLRRLLPEWLHERNSAPMLRASSRPIRAMAAAAPSM